MITKVPLHSVALTITSVMLGLPQHLQAATFTATATVDSTISLTETTPLSCGTIYAHDDGTNRATLTISADGNGSVTASSTGGTSLIVPISGQQDGELSISGAAANTAITISKIDPLTFQNQANTQSFTVTVNPQPAPGTFGQTDPSGNLTIYVGGTLTTVGTGTAYPYSSGAFSGTYDVTVSY